MHRRAFLFGSNGDDFAPPAGYKRDDGIAICATRSHLGDAYLDAMRRWLLQPVRPPHLVCFVPSVQVGPVRLHNDERSAFALRFDDGINERRWSSQLVPLPRHHRVEHQQPDIFWLWPLGDLRDARGECGHAEGVAVHSDGGGAKADRYGTMEHRLGAWYSEKHHEDRVHGRPTLGPHSSVREKGFGPFAVRRNHQEWRRSIRMSRKDATRPLRIITRCLFTLYSSLAILRADSRLRGRRGYSRER